MSEIPVDAESPSASAEPRIIAMVAGVVVSWHPERGWLCEEHQVQPCTHTADLQVVPDPDWGQ